MSYPEVFHVVTLRPRGLETPSVATVGKFYQDVGPATVGGVSVAT